MNLSKWHKRAVLALVAAVYTAWASAILSLPMESALTVAGLGVGVLILSCGALFLKSARDPQFRQRLSDHVGERAGLFVIDIDRILIGGALMIMLITQIVIANEVFPEEVSKELATMFTIGPYSFGPFTVIFYGLVYYVGRQQVDYAVAALWKWFKKRTGVQIVKPATGRERVDDG